MFAGRRFDIEIGLYYNRARYYNPFIGRFLQTDPIGYEDGINWYLYCKNNPLNYVDPTGLLVDVWDPCDITPRNPEEATGNIMVVQAAFAPPSITGNWNVDSFIGFVVNIVSLIGFETALGSSNIPLSWSTGFLWLAFIEVVDYNDVNSDGIIDSHDLAPGQLYEDLILEVRWLEVIGVLCKEDKNAGAFVTYAGYGDPWVAGRAALTAAQYYPEDVPENLKAGDIFEDAWGREWVKYTTKGSSLVAYRYCARWWADFYNSLFVVDVDWEKITTPAEIPVY